jgi:hypothetical protein
VKEIAALRESLSLTDEQTASVRGIADSLQVKLDAHRTRLAETLRSIMPDAAAGAGPAPELLQRFQTELRPEMQQAVADVTAALSRTEDQLSPEQWQNVPAQLRRPGLGGGAGGGGGRGAGFGRGGFNGVALLDRALANPIPVLLELKGLDLTPDQIAKVQAVSAALQAKLDKRRADLGKKFDGAEPQDQQRLFADLRPQLEQGRGDITSALAQVEKILTKAQWQKVPAQVRAPFAPRQGGGFGGGRGGR